MGRGEEIDYHIVNQFAFYGDEVSIETFLASIIGEGLAHTCPEHALHNLECFVATNADDA